MAECITEQEDVTSPIPRAPPPSPEIPHPSIDQFDFMALLSTTSLKRSSPSSSTEHSGPGSPLFYPSPEHIQPPSGSASPSDHSHSDTSLSFFTKLSELSLGTNEVVNGFQKSQPYSGSLPVNGDLHYYRSFMSQQERSNFSDNRGCGQKDEAECTGERRRKISLKRQHNDQEEFISQRIEIIHKKVCHESEYVGSAPTKSRRAYTFSGTMSRPTISANNNHLSVCGDGSDFHVGSLPGSSHVTSLFESETTTNNKTSSGYLSPVVSRTIGFCTDGQGNTDEQQMEGIETAGEEQTQPPNIPISVTQMDMTDWSNRGLTLTGNTLQTDSVPSSSFSFALPSQPPFDPSSLSYCHGVPESTGFSSNNEFTTGSLTGQQQQLHVGSVPRITLSSYIFSKSL